MLGENKHSLPNSLPLEFGLFLIVELTGIVEKLFQKLGDEVKRHDLYIIISYVKAFFERTSLPLDFK